MNFSPSLQKQLDKFFSHRGYLQETKDDINALLLQAIAETENAFGGCTKCYGKGYATVDRTQLEIKFCSCDRGQQLCKILEKGL